MSTPKKVFTLAEVAQHNKADDLWIILGEDSGNLRVYDVTKYQQSHPGGSAIMLENGGKNAQIYFAAADHSESAIKKMGKFCIGSVISATDDVNTATTRTEERSKFPEPQEDCPPSWLNE